mgnify:CR=1 FL=1
MKKVKIISVLGARPQFIKAAALSHILRKKFKEIILHTGQHYDQEMSGAFFKELNIPCPDYYLGAGLTSRSSHVGLMLTRIEKVLLKEKPGLVLVYGDTNSTLAGALAAARLNIPIAHVEAGLRSFRRDMPEEINRVLTDHLSSLLFCPTQNAVNNLRKEGIVKGVHNVGDVMYDAVLFYSRQAENKSRIMERFNLKNKNYFLATVHRAENADTKERLKKIISILHKLDRHVLFPVHPRTRRAIKRWKLKIDARKISLLIPVGYLDMLVLEANAKAILTDSGGIQKEAYFLHTPCLTLRNETEWPETVKAGNNRLVGIDRHKAMSAIREFENRKLKNEKGLFGSGGAGDSILRVLEAAL